MRHVMAAEAGPGCSPRMPVCQSGSLSPLLRGQKRITYYWGWALYDRWLAKGVLRRLDPELSSSLLPVIEYLLWIHEFENGRGGDRRHDSHEDHHGKKFG